MRQRPPRRFPLLFAMATVLAIAAACSGSGGQGGFSPVPASASLAPRPSASVSPSAPASPSASASASPSATAHASASPSAAASASAPTSPPPTASPSPSASPDPYAGVRFECFGIAFPAERLIGDVDSPAAPSAGEFSRWLAEDADPTFPRDGWRLLGESDTGHLYGVRAPEGGEAAAFVVTIRNSGGTWQAEDSGACTPAVRLDETLGGATWTLDPDEAAEIDAETEDFDALVTEMACASGQSSEDRLVAPRIVVEADAITITFGVTPLEGPQDCQGNPASEVRVELPEPLGDRELRDGGVYPPTTVYP